MYSDEVEKIEYFIKKLVELNVRSGRMMNIDDMKHAIDKIDAKFAIFKQAFIESGETLNLEKFNDQKIDIYEDLKILYRLTYQLAEERMVRIENKVKCQLEEMYAETNRYKQRNAIETLSIYGKTLFYQSAGFKQYYENGKIIVELGALSVPAGSYLACLLNCPEIDTSDVYFTFDDKIRVSDYRVNRDFAKIEGDYDIHTYEYKNDEAHSSGFKVDINFEPKDTNLYMLYCGANKLRVFYPEKGIVEYYDKKQGTAFIAESACEISFYAYGASNIKFDMTLDKCSYKSFESNAISAPRQREKILIRCQQGFVLDFSTDGKIFADRTRCFKRDKELMTEKGFSNLSEYLLEEVAYGEPIEYKSVKAIIKNAEDLFYDISSVAIKHAQISELDGELEL